MTKSIGIVRRRGRRPCRTSKGSPEACTTSPGGWCRPRRAAVVFLHGFGEHAGLYHRLGNALSSSGVELWALDEIGHGLSDGERATIRSVDDLVENGRRLAAWRSAPSGEPSHPRGPLAGWSRCSRRRGAGRRSLRRPRALGDSSLPARVGRGSRRWGWRPRARTIRSLV